MTEQHYRGPNWWPLALVLDGLHRRGVRHVTLIWLALGVVAVFTALLEAKRGWSGLPIHIGGMTVGLTVYPPMFPAVLLAIWIGPMWGVVPAYTATLASGLSSGMPLEVAALFALATPLEVMIIWGSMVTLNIHPDLDRPADFWQYLIVALIAATASSLAVLIWNQTQQLDLVAGRLVWQGWVLGDFLQLLLLVAPALYFLGGPVRRWVDRKFGVPPRHEFSYPRSVVLVVILLGILGAMVFQGVGMVMDTFESSLHVLTAQGVAVMERLAEIGLFLGLLFTVALLATFLFSSALARISERERTEGLRDTLTGCFNRRAFRELFQKEAERSRRLGQGIAVIFFDVDHFKQINDDFGHEMGDEVLRQLPRRVRGAMREHDLLFRWGGEEFVALLPHTGASDAEALAERIRGVVADTPLVAQGVARPIGVTLSLGTAGTEQYPASPDLLIAQADRASYVAKHEGRNRVATVATVPD